MGQQTKDFVTGFLNGLAGAVRKKRAVVREPRYQVPIVATLGNSEAYNRRGQGKVDGDAAELAREGKRATPLDISTANAGDLLPQSIPAVNADPSLAEYERAWKDDLPNPDEAPASTSTSMPDESLGGGD